MSNDSSCASRAILTFHQIQWLRSLARMQLRKKEREMLKLAPKPWQSAEEFDAVVQQMQARHEEHRATLVVLNAMAKEQEPTE